MAQLARAANVDYNLAESVKVASFTPRTVGDHTVYEINATLDSEEGFYTGIFDVKFTQTFRTLCVRGDAGVTCPFQVPIRAKFFATAFELDDPDHVEEFKETYGAAPPYRWSYAITVDISDGGAVTVKRKSGSASRTDLYVGKQQLW